MQKFQQSPTQMSKNVSLQTTLKNSMTQEKYNTDFNYNNEAFIQTR